MASLLLLLLLWQLSLAFVLLLLIFARKKQQLATIGVRLSSLIQLPMFAHWFVCSFVRSSFI